MRKVMDFSPLCHKVAYERWLSDSNWRIEVFSPTPITAGHTACSVNGVKPMIVTVCIGQDISDNLSECVCVPV